jgi:hypothetical protein
LKERAVIEKPKYLKDSKKADLFLKIQSDYEG